MAKAGAAIDGLGACPGRWIGGSLWSALSRARRWREEMADVRREAVSCEG